MKEELLGFKLYLIQGKGASDGKMVRRKDRTVELRTSLLSTLFLVSPQLSVVTIQQHLINLYQLERKKATYINSYIDTLRLYGRYKKTTEYEEIDYFPEERYIQQTMSDEEIEAFLRLPPSRKGIVEEKHYYTWTLFFKIMAFTGMRPGEVSHLTTDDVDFGREVLILRETKTNDSRYVPIAPSFSHDLKEHMRSLEGELLFPPKSGGSYRGENTLGSDRWGYQFHTRLARLGIKRKGLRPYDLRPSFITRMLAEDISFSKIQKIVGHKQIATTAHYTHLTTKDIVKTIKKDPLNRKILPLYERTKMFRELVWKLLEDYATSSEEEKQLIEGLKRF